MLAGQPTAAMLQFSTTGFKKLEERAGCGQWSGLICTWRISAAGTNPCWRRPRQHEPRQLALRTLPDMPLPASPRICCNGLHDWYLPLSPRTQLALDCSHDALACMGFHRQRASNAVQNWAWR